MKVARHRRRRADRGFKVLRADHLEIDFLQFVQERARHVSLGNRPGHEFELIADEVRNIAVLLFLSYSLQMQKRCLLDRMLGEIYQTLLIVRTCI